MAKILLVVEDAFDIAGLGGLIVVPGPLQADYDGPRGEFAVTLKTPGGTKKSAILALEHMFQSPPPKEYRWACLLRGLTKADVPLGTEIWIEGEPSNSDAPNP